MHQGAALQSDPVASSSSWYSLSPEWYHTVEPEPRLRAVRFNPKLTLRAFPSSVSFVEQRGCDPGEAIGKTVRPFYVKIYDTLKDPQPSKGSPDLFSGMTFLLLGRGVTVEITDFICSLGGRLTGAYYDGSCEWSNITHVLIGPEVAIQKFSAVKKVVAKVTGRPPIQWVDCDWVERCLQSGQVVPGNLSAPNISRRPESGGAAQFGSPAGSPAKRGRRLSSSGKSPDSDVEMLDPLRSPELRPATVKSPDSGNVHAEPRLSDEAILLRPQRSLTPLRRSSRRFDQSVA